MMRMNKLSNIIQTDLSSLAQSDFVLVLGEPLFLNKALQEALAKCEGYIAYMNPMDYKSDAIKFSQYSKYEVGSEEGICALLLEFFAQKCSSEVQVFIDDLDVGYLSAESSVGEEEFEQMQTAYNQATTPTLVVSTDLFGHNNAENIMKLLHALNQYSQFVVTVLGATPSLIETINKSDETLEEVEELDSFNGVAIYANGYSPKEYLVGGSSFARIAKVNDNDQVSIAFGSNKIQKKFKLDTNLQGMVALCNDAGVNELDYRYKQVKIEKVDA